MPQPPVVVPLEVMRAAPRTAMELSSLRQVAREMGLTPSGLEVALASRHPRYKTLRKMQEWYVRHAAALGGSDADTARAAFNVLLDGLPLERRDAFVRETVARLGAAHRESGSRPPAWVAELVAPRGANGKGAAEG